MYEIIDAHAHIYPDKIAEKASRTIGEFYDIPMYENGTVDHLLFQGQMADVSRYLVHSCATVARQVRPINQYILDEITEHKEFIGFMTLHQDMSAQQIREEIDWCVERGFKGIKLHPDFQKFNIDDERVMPIYEYAEGKLPILFHTGDDRYDYSKPYRLANVARKFSKLIVIGAHFGGYRSWDELDVYDGLDNVYFDTSSSLAFISPEKARQLIKHFGADKFFFGTDYPMWSAEKEVERFLKIDLTTQERINIFAGNIKRVLNI